MSLYNKALNTLYHSSFIALAEDLNRPLTDQEVIENAKYLLECLPYSTKFSDNKKEYNKVKRQLTNLIKKRG